MRSFLRRGILLFLALSLLACQNNQEAAARESAAPTLTKTFGHDPIQVRFIISPQQPSLVERISMRVEVELDAQYQLTFPPIAKKLQQHFYVYSSYTPPFERNKNSKVYRQELQMEALTSGSTPIASLTFFYKNPQSEVQEFTGIPFTTPSFELSVTPLSLESVKNKSQLYPIQDLWGFPPVWQKHKLTILLLVFIGIGLLLWALVKIFKKPPPEPITKTPEELAKEKLQSLLAKGYLQEKNFQAFYFELTMIVREYIESKYHLQAPNLTTEEFLSQIKFSPVFPSEKAEELQSFLQAADVVKYAAYEPKEREIGKSIATAERFVLSASETSY